MLFTVFSACVVLGAFVGFMAGLLGIGGGLIIVPVLVYLFTLLGVNTEVIMPMALATSLATIIITSTSAAFAHQKNTNIPWPLVKWVGLAIGIGASLGAFIADALSAEVLTNFFAIGVVVLASYMLFSIRQQQTGQLPKKPVLSLIGLGTGIIASLMGIAGGAILVPVMSYLGLDMRRAIGLATACGVLVAIFGSLSFIYTGFSHPHLPEFSLGYVYLPALLGITLTSSIFAKVGVYYAAKLPVQKLKKIFAIFLMLVAIKMVTS